MRTKAIRVSKRAKTIILKESSRQTQALKTDKKVTMGDVIEQFAKKLNKKHNFIK